MSSNLNEPGSGGRRLRNQKPAIWSSGQQAPRFDVGAFIASSKTRSLHMATKALGAMASATRRAATLLDHPAPSPDGAPSRRRALPGGPALARAASGTTRLIELAHDRLHQRLPRPAPAARPVPVPAPAAAPGQLRIVRPARNRSHPTDADADILQSIRTVVHMANVAPARPVRLPPPPAPAVPERRADRLPYLAPAEPLPPGPMTRAGAAVAGSLMLALAWPVAATLSLLAHLRGEDLGLAP